MKFHCIADEDTVRGFRLAGVSGEIATTAPETIAAVQAATERLDCGIIILTEKMADTIRPLLDQIRFERERPLIAEIAGPEGPKLGNAKTCVSSCRKPSASASNRKKEIK